MIVECLAFCLACVGRGLPASRSSSLPLDRHVRVFTRQVSMCPVATVVKTLATELVAPHHVLRSPSLIRADSETGPIRMGLPGDCSRTPGIHGAAPAPAAEGASLRRGVWPFCAAHGGRLGSGCRRPRAACAWSVLSELG